MFTFLKRPSSCLIALASCHHPYFLYPLQLNIYTVHFVYCLFQKLSLHYVSLYGSAGSCWLAVSAMLAQMPQLKGTGSTPAATQQICLSESTWEGKLAYREVIKQKKTRENRENRENVQSSSQGKMVEKEEKIRHTMRLREKALKGEIGRHKLINRGNMRGTMLSPHLTVLPCPQEKTLLPPFPELKQQTARHFVATAQKRHYRIKKHMEPQQKGETF